MEVEPQQNLAQNELAQDSVQQSHESTQLSRQSSQLSHESAQLSQRQFESSASSDQNSEHEQPTEFEPQDDIRNVTKNVSANTEPSYYEDLPNINPFHRDFQQFFRWVEQLNPSLG